MKEQSLKVKTSSLPQSRINSEIGKFLSSNILSNSDPTAPDDPKIATFKDLLGSNEDLAKIIKKLWN